MQNDELDLIREKIDLIRGLKVMLDKDLAELYGVKTKRLNEQVYMVVAGICHAHFLKMVLLCFHQY